LSQYTTNGLRKVRYVDRNPVENGIRTTAARKARWIKVSGRLTRSKWLSWVCWPTQKIARVMKLIA
jgi:hypothetical protein